MSFSRVAFRALPGPSWVPQGAQGGGSRGLKFGPNPAPTALFLPSCTSCPRPTASNALRAAIPGQVGGQNPPKTWEGRAFFAFPHFPSGPLSGAILRPTWAPRGPLLGPSGGVKLAPCRSWEASLGALQDVDRAGGSHLAEMLQHGPILGPKLGPRSGPEASRTGSKIALGAQRPPGWRRDPPGRPF